jgi:ABC-type bacteriocin/lantibiotic exporter with double-glycine peptidase domain
MAILDITGIILVGVVATLAAAYTTGFELKIYSPLSIDFIENFGLSSKSVIVLLSFFILIFFVLKSILSVYSSRKILLFMAKKQTQFLNEMFSNIFVSDYSWIKSQNSESFTMAIGRGSESIFLKVIGNFVLLISDIVLMSCILVFLLLYNPSVTFFTFCFLLVISLVLQKVIGKKAILFGVLQSENAYAQNTVLNIVLKAFKEIYTLKKSHFYITDFSHAQRRYADASAKGLWIQQIPKYIFEIALVVGIFALNLFILFTGLENLSVVLIFIIASGRLVPALFRIQSCIIGIKLGHADAINTIRFKSSMKLRHQSDKFLGYQQLINPPSISLESVNFKHVNSEVGIFKNFSLNIDSGDLIGIIGKSGSGKSTILDLILNIYSPNAGEICIFDGSEKIQIENYSNVGYVSQNPVIFRGSVLQNITLGVNDLDIDYNLVDFVVKHSNLQLVLDKMPEGLSTELSNLESILSGGEKQRISFARALYSKPKLLVIDEGTSSLDVTSEKLLTNYLTSLKGQATIIIVTHRITTLRNIEKIYFFEEGKITGSGNYNSLQNLVPDFKIWAESFNTELE